VRVHASLSPGAIRFTLGGREWTLCRPLDLESLWNTLDDEDFTEDERLPYWVELWPSSLALALWLERQAAHIRGRTCLELGCGLGFTTLTAFTLGARVMGMDYELEALRYARRNAAVNHLDFSRWLVMDWRRPALTKACCEVIWGGDILYEKRFAAPVLAFLEHALAPGGRVWMAEPGRNTYEAFMGLAIQRGWQGKCVYRERVEALHVQSAPVSVNVWELQR
jgi:predicted nicotinamide N-methyase